MGTQLPLPKRGGAPNFRPISVVAKWLDGGWIKMPLGRKVGLSPSDIVLDGDPASSPHKGAEPRPTPPIFGPSLLWPNGWMDEDATWYGSRPQPRPQTGTHAAPSPAKDAQQPPLLFSAHVYCGRERPSQTATAELLLDRERELIASFAICCRPSVCCLSSVCL